MDFEYIQKYYKVPAEIGRRVTVLGRPGVITESLGSHIGVTFDDGKKTSVQSCHPTYEVEYLGMGAIPKLTRSQQRWHQYLKVADLIGFPEWLKNGQHK